MYIGEWDLDFYVLLRKQITLDSWIYRYNKIAWTMNKDDVEYSEKFQFFRLQVLH